MKRKRKRYDRKPFCAPNAAAKEAYGQYYTDKPTLRGRYQPLSLTTRAALITWAQRAERSCVRQSAPSER